MQDFPFLIFLHDVIIVEILASNKSCLNASCQVDFMHFNEIGLITKSVTTLKLTTLLTPFSNESIKHIIILVLASLWL